MGEMNRRMLYVVASAIAGICLVSGCYVDPKACQSDSDCFQGERCEGAGGGTAGTCVPDPDATVADADTSEPEDTGGPEETGSPPEDTDGPDTGGGDTGADTDTGGGVDTDTSGGGDGCTPWSDEEFCRRHAPPCGAVTGDNGCGEMKTLPCDQVLGNNCTCDYKGKSKGVCDAGNYDDQGNCSEPDGYEEHESSGADDKDNDCDGYVDEVFSMIEASSSDVYCGLRTKDDSIVCWNAEKNEKAIVEKAPSGTGYRDVAVGNEFGCAVTSQKSITCWRKPGGQTNAMYIDEYMGLAGEFIDVEAAENRACGRRPNGGIVCWGVTDPSTEADDSGVDGTFYSFDSGSDGDCGIQQSDDTIRCWNRSGDLSLPDTSMNQVSVGGDHICAIDSSNELACAGKSGHLDLDDRTLSPPSGTFIEVAVGLDFACAISTGGDLSCWTTDPKKAYQPPASGNGSYETVAAGWNSVCGLKSDGRLECWGSPCGGTSEGPCWAP